MKNKLLLNTFPDDHETIDNLFIALEKGNDFTLDRLYNLTSPKSKLILAKILNFLVDSEDLSVIFRIESPSFGGIADFKSSIEIPKEIHDWRRDVMMPVTQDDILVLYRRNDDKNFKVVSSGQIGSLLS